MYQRVFSPLILLHFLASNALALFIAHDGSTSPFSISYSDPQSPLVFVLQVANESASTVNVLSWQLMNLELRPLPESQGSLEFHSAGAPPDSMFGQTPGPQSDLSAPSSTVSVFDIDPNFAGEPVAPHSRRNILQLAVQANAGTIGQFQLIFPQAENPDADSSWFDADEFVAKAFENVATSSFSNMILLGTIDIGKEPSLPFGDYNGDGRVDGADYSRWRSDYGIQVTTLGAGADGNHDLIVDAADYVVWRKSISDTSINTSAVVPEPASFLLFVSAIAIFGIFHGVPQPRRERRDALKTSVILPRLPR
jgi:hypothetical protein